METTTIRNDVEEVTLELSICPSIKTKDKIIFAFYSNDKNVISVSVLIIKKHRLYRVNRKIIRTLKLKR